MPSRSSAPRSCTSLDESGDITEFQASGGACILDTDNPACGKGSCPGHVLQKGELSGYLTIDVVNYCTNFFPNQPEFYHVRRDRDVGLG